MNNKQQHTFEKPIVVRFSGDSGDGMQLTGDRFTLQTALSGINISTFPDFPAEIRAPAGTTFGVSAFQIAFSSSSVLTAGEEVDVLVAMNPAALKVNMELLSKGATIIADSGQFTVRNLQKANYNINPLEDNNLSGFKLVSANISELTLQAVKQLGLNQKTALRARNMWALGLILWMYDHKLDKTEKWLKQKFAKLPTIAEGNIAALKAGNAYGENIESSANIVQKKLKQIKVAKGEYRAITGAEAIAYGLITGSKLANINLIFCSYPITPASPVLHYLAKLKVDKVTTFQAEDEIAACCSAIGASYAGSLGITSSSGPGIALKMEALGLAVMTELPLVVINSQRAGPSTGMPTKTEQADLLQALYGRNGEAPLVVLAPATPSECYDFSILAIKIAIRYMTPVILLTDGYLSNAAEPWLIPNINNMQSFNTVFTTNMKQVNPYQRNSETLARPWIKPGTKGLEHRIGGLEKENISGNISYDSQNHQKMTNLRQEKINLVANEFDSLNIDGPVKGKIIVLGWGSTYGSIRESVLEIRKMGYEISHIQIRYISPLHKDLESILSGFKKIILPEINSGQLASVLKSKFVLPIISISQVTGKPISSSFLVKEIIKFIKE